MGQSRHFEAYVYTAGTRSTLSSVHPLFRYFPLHCPLYGPINALLQEDPAAILEIKEDIRDECSKLGEVTNVVLFDRELDGVASVRFADAEAAKACVRVRHFRSSAYASTDVARS